uniref:Uncharacterized protein n=1 Tax=Oryza glaberrima TaxID=4538 RepID=I1PTG3_ORYGL
MALFSLDADEEDASRRLRVLHIVETAGVFDMVVPLLEQADAHGRLVLWRLEQEDGSDKGAVCSCICISRRCDMGTRRVLVTQGWGRWVRAARPERRVRAGGDECPRRQRGNSDSFVHFDGSRRHVQEGTQRLAAHAGRTDKLLPARWTCMDRLTDATLDGRSCTE